MYFDDCLIHAVTSALDEDLPPELLPLTVTRHAGLLAGHTADHLGAPTWG
jgi:hypothetical protein